jgi:hypothetical protein
MANVWYGRPRCRRTVAGRLRSLHEAAAIEARPSRITAGGRQATVVHGGAEAHLVSGRKRSRGVPGSSITDHTITFASRSLLTSIFTIQHSVWAETSPKHLIGRAGRDRAIG